MTGPLGRHVWSPSFLSQLPEFQHWFAIPASMILSELRPLHLVQLASQGGLEQGPSQLCKHCRFGVPQNATKCRPEVNGHARAGIRGEAGFLEHCDPCIGCPLPSCAFCRETQPPRQKPTPSASCLCQLIGFWLVLMRSNVLYCCSSPSLRRTWLEEAMLGLT